MNHPRTRRTARSAFTLIELLVVIAIIAVLVSLISSAVMRVRIVATRTQVANDITKMQDGLEAAKKRYGDAPALPSRLVLFNDLTSYTTNPPAGESAIDTQLRKRSADTLRKMFGQRLLVNGSFVSWDGTNNKSKTLLEGPQCLVFYLGGMTSTSPNGCLGFSTDPLRPDLAPAPGKDRIGPFFDFKSSRLVPMSTQSLVTGSPQPTTTPAPPTATFFVYLDAYRYAGDALAQPYAYFSTTTTQNGYNPYYLPSPATQISDCNSLGLWPYVDGSSTVKNAPPKYLNPSTYQIISAGPDGVFGQGGGPPNVPTAPFPSSVYDPVSGAKDAVTRDNQANFSKSTLGGPQS